MDLSIDYQLTCDGETRAQSGWQGLGHEETLLGGPCAGHCCIGQVSPVLSSRVKARVISANAVARDPWYHPACSLLPALAAEVTVYSY
jgi:hypothetical protein